MPGSAEASPDESLSVKKIPTITSLNDIHPQLLDFLYNRLGSRFDSDIKELESFTGIKREHFAYATITFMSLYMIFGTEAELLCNLIGFVYPAFVTIQILEMKAKDRALPWLLYWMIFALLSLNDFYADHIMRVIPLYWILKAVFLVYLFLPQTCGIQMFYSNIVAPGLAKIENAFANYKAKNEN